MQGITPFLWFDDTAEEAADFYVSVLPRSEIREVTRYPEGSGDQAGHAMVVEVELDGLRLAFLNGGPAHQLTEAFSLVVHPEDQAELDRVWDALLLGGGTPLQCGWLTDRFGVSWQVVPTAVTRLLADPDPARAARVGTALLTMTKLDIAELEAAAEGDR